MTADAGATDEHRALNYLAVRYPAIYARAAEAFAGNLGLTRLNCCRTVTSEPQKDRRRQMTMPGFTAEASLYNTNPTL